MTGEKNLLLLVRWHEANAVGLNIDAAFLEQRADGLFEGLLAHAENVADFLGDAVVVVREASALLRQDRQHLLAHRADAPVAGLAEREVELAVGPDRADVARH